MDNVDEIKRNGMEDYVKLAVFEANQENIWKDFMAVYGNSVKVLDDNTTTALFNVFCAGIMAATNPDSHFNSEYSQ